MSSSAARARDEDQLVVEALLPAVHGRFTSPRSYLSRTGEELGSIMSRRNRPNFLAN